MRITGRTMNKATNQYRGADGWLITSSLRGILSRPRSGSRRPYFAEAQFLSKTAQCVRNSGLVPEWTAFGRTVGAIEPALFCERKSGYLGFHFHPSGIEGAAGNGRSAELPLAEVYCASPFSSAVRSGGGESGLMPESHQRGSAAEPRSASAPRTASDLDRTDLLANAE